MSGTVAFSSGQPSEHRLHVRRSATVLQPDLPRRQIASLRQEASIAADIEQKVPLRMPPVSPVDRFRRVMPAAGPSLLGETASARSSRRTLRDHPKPKVRGWATATLRGLATTIENAHDEEEERKARREARGSGARIFAGSVCSLRRRNRTGKMRDGMEYTEGQSPATRRPVELANPRLPRSERSRQGARAATSGDTDEAQSDPARHHPGTPLGRCDVAVSTYSCWRRHRPAESGGLHRRQDWEGTIRQSYPADPDRSRRGVAGRLRRWNVPYPLHQALRRPRCRRIALHRQQVTGRSGSLHQLHSNE